MDYSETLYGTDPYRTSVPYGQRTNPNGHFLQPDCNLLGNDAMQWQAQTCMDFLPLDPLAGELAGITANPSEVAERNASDMIKQQDLEPWHLGLTEPQPISTGAFPPMRLPPTTGDLNTDSGFVSMQQSPDFQGYTQQGMSMELFKKPQSVRSHPKGPPSTTSSRRRSSFTPMQCSVPGCIKFLNSRSEQTKHDKQHGKPYKCVFDGCPKQEDGFGTPNDLQRHMRDKHKIYGAKDGGYVCCICQLADTPHKWWPRKDNFKAHVMRKHPDRKNEWEAICNSSFQPSRPDDTLSEVGTAISGQLSNYYPQSQPDSDLTYEFEAPPLPRTDSVLQDQQHYQGEPRMLAPPYGGNELAGYGNAHQADVCYPDNRPTGTCESSWPPAYDAHAFLSRQTDAVPATHVSMTRTRSDRSAKKTAEKASDRGGIRKASGPKPWANRNGKKCTECSRIMTNEKKHMRRHEPDFQCTDYACFNRFGAKYDWIRHEKRMHKMHWQTYLCTHMKQDSSEICNTFFDTRPRIRQHLAGPKHDIPPADIEHMIDEMTLGSEGAKRFWCGHCKAVIDNPKPQGNKSLEYRLSHIGDHLNLAQGASADDYVCVFMQRRKGDLSDEEMEDLRNMRIRPGDFDVYEPHLERRLQIERELEVAERAKAAKRLEERAILKGPQTGSDMIELCLM